MPLCFIHFKCNFYQNPKMFFDDTFQTYSLSVYEKRIFNSPLNFDDIQSKRHWVWPFDWHKKFLFGMYRPICLTSDDVKFHYERVSNKITFYTISTWGESFVTFSPLSRRLRAKKLRASQISIWPWSPYENFCWTKNLDFIHMIQ